MSTPVDPLGAPGPLDHRQMLLGIAPAPGRWRAATIASLGLVIPATALTLAGWGHEATLVALGAFTAMYGTTRPYRLRGPFLAGVAVLLVAVTVLGALVGSLGDDLGARLALVATMLVVSAGFVFVANALAIGPPGGFFFVMVTGLAAHVAATGVPVGDLAVAATLGAASSWVVSMAPALWRSDGPQKRAVAGAVTAVERYVASVGRPEESLRARTAAATALNVGWNTLHESGLRDRTLFETLYDAHLRFAAAIAGPSSPATGGIAHVPLGRTEATVRLRRHAHTLSAQFLTVVRVLLAVALSGVLAYALGTGRADWAMVSAVLVLHGGVERVRSSYRALHRVVGTVAGVGLFAVIAVVEPDGLALVAVLGVLAFVIEMLVVRHYALAVTFITALVLLISEPPGQIDTGIVVDRIVDTLIGAVVAVVVLWTTGRRFDAGVLPYELHRTSAAVRALADVLESQSAVTVPASRWRRRLQVDLLDTAAAADIAYRHAPERARALWPTYALVQDVGYDVLAHCWLHGDDRAPVPPDLRARIANLPD